jgi:hypothetical protein
MRITSNGNVGIGTNAPEQMLYVNGGITINAFASNETGICFRPGMYSTLKYNTSILSYDHTGDTYSDGISINGYDGVSFCTGANTRQERMRITSAGNVGIATTAPNSTYALQVGATSDNRIIGVNCIELSTFLTTNIYGVRLIAYDNGVTGNNMYIQTRASPTAGWANSFTFTNGGALSISGTLSKGGGSFDIEHPNPVKKEQGYRLRHCFVESPTRGDNIYTFNVTTTSSNETFAIDLPDYFHYLNENPRCSISCEEFSVLSMCCARVTDDLLQVQGLAQHPGRYMVTVYGTRKDQMMVDYFDNTGGVEYISSNI